MAGATEKPALLRIVEHLERHRVEFMVIGLDDLISIKRHLGRPKDQSALLQLMALKRLREQT